jgi:trk system potassium uptake protein TrkH
LKDIYERLKGKKSSLSLHTKIVLTSTLILLVIPFFFFLLVEWNSGFASFPLKEKILSSFFQTLTPRTAGFHVAEIKEYTLASKILTISLMFIGASPGGTGGGVKTVTFFLIMLGIYNFVKGKYEVNVFRRRIENTFTMRAFVIAGISGVIAFTGVWLLSIIEKGTPFLSLLFEEVSALGTVGLSLGGELHPNCSLVSNFSVAGKLIIIITMLFGRVGSLTLATALITRSKRELTKLPRGEVFTG